MQGNWDKGWIVFQLLLAGWNLHVTIQCASEGKAWWAVSALAVAFMLGSFGIHGIRKLRP